MAEYCEKETIYLTLYHKLCDEARKSAGERRDFYFDIIDNKLKSWCDDILTANVRPSDDEMTIYGYSLKDLAVFAEACRKEGIMEHDMHDFVLNVGAAIDIVTKEMDEMLRENVERIIKGGKT